MFKKVATVEQGEQTITIDFDTMLWHNRLGHMSEKSMKVLPGLKCVNMDFCESCVYGKQKRVSFMKIGKEKKSERLELVHTDVWGPAQVSSLGGSHYYVHLLMMQLEKYGFISLDLNLMYFKLLRNGNAWLKMRLVGN